MLALLVMLVLSGLALVAMNSVSSSNTMSGMHRIQAQSFSMSDGLNQLGMLRSGQQATVYHAQLRDTAGGVTLDDIGDDADRELAAMRRGGFVKLTSDDTGDDGFDNSQVQLQGADTLFDDDQFVHGVPSELDSEFGYIVRDPLLGPRAEGYGDEFCFIQVTVGSQTRIGGGSGIGQGRALGRNASTAMIGPVECE